MLDYRINTFLTLYKELNYRRTAELLNMTQPGVTQHIRFLENTYNVKLFEYDGKTVSRTCYADMLKKHLNYMIDEEKALRNSFKLPETSFLKIGATRTIGEFEIAPLIKRYLSRANNNLEFIVENTEMLLRKLDNGELDFALIEGGFDKDKYDYHLYKNDSFVGICSRNHHFAEKKILWKDIFNETVLLREIGSGSRIIFEQLLSGFGYSVKSFNRIVTINNLNLTKQLIADNAGITFAYKSAAASDSRLAAFEISGASVIREFNYVYRNKRTAAEKIKLFEAKK